MIKVLFELKQEYYWTSFLPIINLIKRDKKFDVSIVVGKNEIRKYGFLLVPQKKRIEKHLISKGYKITQKKDGFDVVICGDTPKNPLDYKNAILCNVDHGVSIKSQRYRKFKKFGIGNMVRFIEGDYREKKLKEYGFYDSTKIFKVGMPKLDRLLDDSFDKHKILQKFQLNNTKKTILFAPSYKPTSIFDLTPKLSELKGYNIIIKLHPYSWSGKYVSHRQHRFVENLAKNNNNITLIPKKDIDILPFLFVSDTLISEASSVMNEFLALGRCGIIFQKLGFHSDGKSVLEEDTSNWLKDSFIHINNPNQLEDAIKTALNPSEKRKKAIFSDRDKIYSFVDGKSAERVKNRIKKLIKEKRR